MKKFRVISLGGVKKLGAGETTDTDFDLSFCWHDKPKMEAYYMIHKDNAIALDKRLQGNDVRVYFFLCGHMLPGGWLEVTQAYIADQFGAHRSNVSASIKRLITCGYIESVVKRGTGRKFLRVVDTYASKGSIAHRKAIQAEVEEDNQ